MFNINIGIGVTIDGPGDNFFVNGIKQNCIILRDTLIKTGIVDNVYYVNFGKEIDYANSTWKEYLEHIISPKDALNCVNVLISAGTFVSGEYLEAAHSKGIKLVTHVMGNEYYLLSERSLFRNDNNSFVKKTPHYSAVWISPHLHETNKNLWEVITEAPVYIAPYIWSPQFLMQYVTELKKQGYNDVYIPNNNPSKRIGVFESNINIVKTCIFPIIIGEKLYTNYSNDIDIFRVFNSNELVKNKDFVRYIHDLRIHKNSKLFFESRYPIANVLLKHTDIVLSHQRDCGLNYLYFDAAWLGYPVVHNSKFVKELGWYYGDFEADEAVAHLHNIISTFDHSEQLRKEYLQKSREYISKFLPEHERNVSGYRTLIERLMFSFKK